MPRPNLELLAVLASLLISPAMAELADRSKPIHIDAGSGSRDERNGLSVLEGGVTLEQGTLSLKAERATLQQQPSGDQQVRAQGRPVEFRQKLEGGRGRLEARAEKLEYDSKTGDVKLIGQAWLKSGGDEISASSINYNTQTEQYRAEGGTPTAAGSDGRLRMVIQPRIKPEAAGSDKPAEGPSKP